MNVIAPERIKRHLRSSEAVNSVGGNKKRAGLMEENPVKLWNRHMNEFEEDFWRNKLRKMI